MDPLNSVIECECVATLMLGSFSNHFPASKITGSVGPKTEGKRQDWSWLECLLTTAESGHKIPDLVQTSLFIETWRA